MHKMIHAAAIRFARNACSLTKQNLIDLRATYDDRFMLDVCVRFGPGLDVVEIEVIAGDPLGGPSSLALGFDEVECLSIDELIVMVEPHIEKAISHSGISLNRQFDQDCSLYSVGPSTSPEAVVHNAVEVGDTDSEVRQLRELKSAIADLVLENHLLSEVDSGSPDGQASVAGRS